MYPAQTILSIYRLLSMIGLVQYARAQTNPQFIFEFLTEAISNRYRINVSAMPFKSFLYKSALTKNLFELAVQIKSLKERFDYGRAMDGDLE